MSQIRNEDSDYGDLPRSKKQLIDLPRSSFMDNEVGDILDYNKELNIDAILWHHSDIPELELELKTLLLRCLMPVQAG